MENPQVLSTISQIWPNGISSHQWDNGAYEVKFHGNPFSVSSSKAEAIASKRMACHLLSSLVALGYDPVVSTDLGRTTDLTSWFFQRNTAATGHHLTPPHVFCLSLSRSDKLQMVNATPEFQAILTDAARGGYAYGVQNTEPVGQDFEVKLSGYPWHTASLEEGIHARRLLLEVIRKFDSHRYKLLTTANLKGTADCLFFKQDLSSAPGETSYMMLSLNASDRIRLVDANPEVTDIVRFCISKYWNQGLQEQRDYSSNLGPNAGAYEWKLNGQPWSAYYGNDYIVARHLMAVLLHEFSIRGWRVICSADVSAKFVHQQNGPDYPIDVHSWFLAHTGVGSDPVGASRTPDFGFRRDLYSSAGFSSTAPTPTPHAPPLMPGAVGSFEAPPPAYDEVVKEPK